MRGALDAAASIKGLSNHTDYLIAQLDGEPKQRNNPKRSASPEQVQELITQRLRKAKADASVAERNAQLAEGKVIDLASVSAIMIPMISNARSKLLALGTRLAPILLGVDNIPQIKATIDEAIYEALVELSETDYSKAVVKINGTAKPKVFRFRRSPRVDTAA